VKSGRALLKYVVPASAFASRSELPACIPNLTDSAARTQAGGLLVGPNGAIPLTDQGDDCDSGLGRRRMEASKAQNREHKRHAQKN